MKKVYIVWGGRIGIMLIIATLFVWKFAFREDHTQVVDTQDNRQLCQTVFQLDNYQVKSKYSCDWSSCTSAVNDVIEGFPFMTIQAQPSCSVGLGRNGPEGNLSDFDVDFTYFDSGGMSLEQWVEERKRDLEAGGLVFFERDNAGGILLETVDHKQRYDSRFVYYLVKQYKLVEERILEISVFVPESRHIEMQNEINRLLDETEFAAL